MQHQQVMAIVDIRIVQFHRRFQERRRPFRITVGEIERLDQQFLMLALLLGRVRIDQNRLRVQHLARKLARGQDHVERVFEAHRRRVDRHALVMDVLVQHEVDAAGAAHHVEHAADIGVAEVE